MLHNILQDGISVFISKVCIYDSLSLFFLLLLLALHLLILLLFDPGMISAGMPPTFFSFLFLNHVLLM